MLIIQLIKVPRIMSVFGIDLLARLQISNYLE
jgi:hypothetical protein